MGVGEENGVAPTGDRRQGLRWLRRGVSLLIFLAVLGFFVLPQIADAGEALHTLSDVDTPWLALGIILEIACLLSYSLLTRSVLPEGRPSFWWLFRCDITGNGVSHVVPGGAAAASALRYRLIRDGGAEREDVLVATAVQGVGSAFVLNLLLWCALVVSIPRGGWHPIYLTAAIVCAIVVAGTVLLFVAFTRGEEQTHALGRRVAGWSPARFRGRIDDGVRRSSARFGRVLGHGPTMRRAALWATANWVLDAASLWVFLAAYGWHASPLDLAVAFGLANVVAMVPITPGGIGIIEGVLIPTLVGFGGPDAEVLLGVVSWRLIQFWAPIPAALACFLSLQAQPRAGRGARAIKASAVTLFSRKPEPPP